MKTTKLLTIIWAVITFAGTDLIAQCSLINTKGSTLNTTSQCAPADITISAGYKFYENVDTSLIRIVFVWNDGAGATDTLVGKWEGTSDSVYAVATHTYFPTNECAMTAEAILIFDGEPCLTRGHQQQTFTVWGTDEENGGVLGIAPPIYYVCEGDPIVNITFDDNTTFNCNPTMDSEYPNDYYRWVRFIYNTDTIGTNRIPEVTVQDDLGIDHLLNGVGGGFLGSLIGPVVEVPIPAEVPNQTSFEISAPAGAVEGDIFEIVMQNWNVCNAYDNIRSDGLPPVNLIRGDNDPIEITARIEVIAPNPLTVTNLFEYCTGDNIRLEATAGGDAVRWYKDATLDTLLYTGNNFYPEFSSMGLNPDVPGNYNFYVVSYGGMCESAPSVVNLIIHQSPETADAGDDKVICADTITLAANKPSAGIGAWTTTSTANILSPNSDTTHVTGLEPSSNEFTWTIVNGPCSTSDVVEIISDRQPDAADAGTDQFLCNIDPTTLNATPPNLNGSGQWNILSGMGTFGDNTSPNTSFSGMMHDTNLVVWRVFSEHGACPVSYDTLMVAADFSAGPANAGIDIQMCETSTATLSAQSAFNNGTGYWSIANGGGTLSDSTDRLTTITNLAHGVNSLLWTVQSKLKQCPDFIDTVLVIRDENPGTAFAGLDKDYCLITQDTLAATPPTVGIGEWSVVTSPVITPPTFSPNINTADAYFSVDPGNEGMYQLEWRLINGLCESADTITIDFGMPHPPADAGSDSSICGYSLELNANAITHGTGTWVVVNSPAMPVIAPSIHNNNATITASVGDEGVYTMLWQLESGSCDITSDTVQIEFKPSPAGPITSSYSSCGPDSFNISIATETNAEVHWYNSASGSSNFFVGQDYQSTVLSNNTSYFVSYFDTLTLCESSRSESQITINEVPVEPYLIPDTLCEPGQAALHALVAPPANAVIWFTDTSDVSVMDTSMNITIDNIDRDTLFWAQSLITETGCVSNKAVTNIKVWNPIQPPLTYPDSSCGPGVFMLHAEKSNAAGALFWYDGDDKLINVGDSMPTALIPNDSIFYIAEYNPTTRCTGPTSELNLTIFTPPGLPNINDTSSCGPSAFVLSPQKDSTVSTYRWYDSPVDGLLYDVSDTLTTPFLSANSQYFVSGVNYNTGCEGNRKQVDVDIYAEPAMLDIYGPTIVLKGQSNVVFFAVNGRSTSEYFWEIPSDVILESDGNDFVRLGFPETGDYVVSTYEVTPDGCVGIPVYHSISVFSDSIAVDIGDYEQNGCTADPILIQPWLFGGRPPYNYLWTGDTNYLSVSNELVTTFTPPGTGTYTLYLEVFDINLKSAKDSVQITIYESPTTNITNTDLIACIEEPYQLNTASTGSEPFTHIWGGPVHYLNSYLMDNPIFTPRESDTATFFYMLTDENGCKAHDTISIVSDKPVADFNILTDPGCSPLFTQFENTSTGASNYIWTLEEGEQTTSFEPEHTYVNTTNVIKYQKVILEARSGLGCVDTRESYVMVWPTPVADITALPQTSCNPAHTLLVSTPGNKIYHWSFGDSSDDQSTEHFNMMHTYETDGLNDEVFTARVITESSLECFDTAQIDITVHATPVADFEVSPKDQLFPSSTFSVDNTTEGNWRYMWNFGDGEHYSELQEPGSVSYSASGNYNISLQVFGDHCSDSANTIVRLKPAPPVAVFKGADNGCMPHTVTLINESEYADSYFWEFGDGSVSTARDPSYTYYESGIYKINLRVSGVGGVDTYSDTARVYILPHSFFDIAPRYVYVNDEPVHYFNLSDNADIVEWDFGDGETSTEQNPKHVYKEAGTYDVTLKVWTTNDCFDLYIMENAVFAEPSGIVEYPNAFRPNSPLEENRTFMPGVIDHVDDYHLMIFNRWGELIFESRSPEIGWDGMYKGEVAKQDVYMWKVKGTYTDGKGFIKTGNVTLLY